jgi:hypothetical protein
LIVSDSLGYFIEPELLASSVLSPSLKDDLSITKHFSDSVEWKFRHDVEWSVDMETKLFIQSLGLSLLFLVKIEDLPSLMFTTIVTPDSDCVSFFIFASFNIKDLVVLPIDELSTFILEDLEPS